MEHITTAEIEQQVLDAMRIADCEPDDTSALILDGKIQRYRVKGDKHSETSGAYCIYSDGWPAGWFMDWHNGEAIYWKFNGEGKFGTDFLDSPEYQEMRRLSEEHQKQLKAELAAKQKAATLAARRLWKETTTEAPDDFPYLKAKGVQSHGIKRYALTKLLVPMRNIDGEIQTLQYIDVQGVKRFYPDAPVKGAFFAIGLTDGYLRLNPEMPILLCEGYATAATIHECQFQPAVYNGTSVPVVAAMNAGNLFPVAEALKDKYPGHPIIIMADNDRHEDGYNTGIKKAEEAVRRLALQGIIYPEFAQDEEGSDWNDYAAIHGKEATAILLKEKIAYELRPEHIKAIAKNISIINGNTLSRKKFDPVNWAIDGIIPAGLTLLAGGPKTGKSLFALHIALGVAIGGCVLGKVNVEQGDVLYLALEDTERRLQERIMGSSLPENCDLSHIDFVTRSPRQDEGGLDFIKWWLSEHPEAKLVIVDTLQKFRKQSKGKLIYADDYDAMSELKKIAEEFNVAVIALHHLKKLSAKEEMATDWMTHLSGSMGLTGAADTILVLKRERASTYGTLKMSGRDIEEREYRMKLDGFGWFITDDDPKLSLPTWKKQILDYLEEHGKVTPMALSDKFRISIEGARKQLQRAHNDGLIKRLEFGVYVMNS